jgi:hypothetical protein
MSAVIAPDRLEEAETLEALDFEPICQAAIVTILVLFGLPLPLGARPCAKPADFLCTCTRCGAVSHMCGQHHDLLQADNDGRCGSCGARGPGAEIFAFTPIRGI